MQEDEAERQIAANIKRFREEWGISAAGLAAIMGVPPNTVQSYELGNRGALKAVYRLADAFERAADDMRSKNPPPPREPYPPAFGLTQVAPHVDADLVEKARLLLQDVNRTHRERMRRRPPQPPAAGKLERVRASETEAELAHHERPASSSASVPAGGRRPKRRGTGSRA